MFRNQNYRIVFGIWLGWVVILLGYQVMVTARLSLVKPDRAVSWTENETLPGSQDGKIYLNEPFLNQHVSWDSEYYLAIANNGYEDPAIFRIQAGGPVSTGGGFWPFVIPSGSSAPLSGIPLSYAFFPFYPLVIHLVSLPLSLLGLNPIATATLAGVIVSTLGTLAGMLALYELARDYLGDDGGLRAAFYLVIFPSGFFLAQVYTEGLFVGLSFWSLVLIRRKRLGWAAVLAILATFTRAVGIALIIPMLNSWIKEGKWLDMDMEWRQVYFNGLNWRAIGSALMALSPLLFYVLWKISYYGMAFSKIEQEYFGRTLLALGTTFVAWSEALRSMFGNNPHATSYYLVELLGIVLGFSACIYGLRRYPELAWYGLAVVFLSFTSGPAQGMHRYILAAPPVFLFLSELGKNKVFDRTWTVASILLMGLMATMYTFDMWAG